jgi:hypothetical protein
MTVISLLLQNYGNPGKRLAAIRQALAREALTVPAPMRRQQQLN